MRFALAIALVACGGSVAPRPMKDRPAPRATAPWPAAGECIERVTESDPCVQITAADAGAIRDVVLAYLDQPRDVPDIGIARELVGHPIAQWTSAGYQFRAMSAEGTPVLVELTVSEKYQGGRASFTFVVEKTDAGWQMTR